MKITTFLLALHAMILGVLLMIVFQLYVQSDSLRDILLKVDGAYQECHIDKYPLKPDYRSQLNLNDIFAGN